MKERYKALLTIALIVFVGFLLRTYNINWDQNNHLHPDERFLTMVSNAMKIPTSIETYLSPQVSRMNPANVNFSFFVYGTLPIVLNKIMVTVLNIDTYHLTTLAGRYMSAVADTLSILIIIKLVELFEKKYKFSRNVKFLSGLAYAIAVLPIQNAHFFTVDATASFFMIAALYCSVKFFYIKKIPWIMLSAFMLGCAVGSKISSVYIAPLIGWFLIMQIFPLKKLKKERIISFIGSSLLFVGVFYLTLRFADPYLFQSSNFLSFQPNELFMKNIEQLKSFSNPAIWFPPSFQWTSKKPIIFPLQNIAFFGLGIPLFFTSLYGGIQLIRKKYKEIIFLIAWALMLFFYQGSQFVTSMRYFYPLYPILAMCAGYGLWDLVSCVNKNYRRTGYAVGIFLWLVWPMSFMSIYTHPHSRVTASQWIFDNVPASSRLAMEHWDDPLPLYLDQRYIDRYKGIQLPIFEYDTPNKWQRIEEALAQSDYIILSSNRAYGSLLPISKKFPITSQYYHDLFVGTGDFVKVKEFTSFPEINLGFFSIPINDQWAEEAFTVYDHPKVTIFKHK